MPKFKLISTFNGNDTIPFEASPEENPETRALEELGWFVVSEDGTPLEGTGFIDSIRESGELNPQ